MSYQKSLLLLVVCFSFFSNASCKKANGNTNTGVTPSNLVVNAAVSTDSSGSVSFTAQAENAATYTYDFGDGIFITATTQINVQHIYTAEGANNYTVKVTATSSTGLSVSKTISVAVTHVLSLVWSDEFNTDGSPDSSKWGYDIGTGGNGWGNNEAEYYTNRADNSIVTNGMLKITVKQEAYSGSAYTSARLLSKDKYAFTYGKVEFRAKLPAGRGTWPALWMLGSDIGTTGWPGCGEIDIMEHLGRDLNNIYSTFHYPGHSGGSANGATKMIQNATTDFHIYTLEWSASLIKMSVDGQQIHSLVNNNSVPFNHDFFLIMNVAIGGNFGGDIDPAFSSASMEVDYVRVYK